MTLTIGASTALTAWGVFFLMYVIVPRYRASRRLRKWEPNCVRRRLIITDEWIAVGTDSFSSTLHWDQFSSHRRTEGLVVLLFKFSRGGLVVPKSFFTDETLWETFVALVERKLSDLQRERIGSRADDLAPGAALDAGVKTESRDPGGPGQREPIHGEGVLSPAEVRRAQRIIEGLSWRRIYPVVFLAVFGLLTVQAVAWNAFQSTLLVPLGIGVGVVLTNSVILPHLLLWRQWRKREGIFEPQRLAAFTDCLTISTPTTAVTVNWSSISRHVLRKELLIIQFENGSYNIIPRSFFPCTGDWNALVQLVEETARSTP
jgi:hypothetical protein